MLDETVRQAPDEPLGLDNLAPGIQGYTVDCGEEGLYVPLIISTEPEKGNVGKYLDTLRDLPLVKIPNVLSGRRSFYFPTGNERQEKHSNIFPPLCRIACR